MLTQKSIIVQSAVILRIKNFVPYVQIPQLYDGAKKMILVDDVDNRQFLCELVESMWEELSKKKEKNCT